MFSKENDPSLNQILYYIIPLTFTFKIFNFTGKVQFTLDKVQQIHEIYFLMVLSEKFLFLVFMTEGDLFY